MTMTAGAAMTLTGGAVVSVTAGGAMTITAGGAVVITAPLIVLSAATVVSAGPIIATSIAQAMAMVDGVMLGRHAYHEPWFLSEVDRLWFDQQVPDAARIDVVQAMRDYAALAVAAGAPLRAVTRHMLGLYQGMPGARAWRRMLSDSRALAGGDADLILAAAAQVTPQRLAA